jgi:hypothetical protein
MRSSGVRKRWRTNSTLLLARQRASQWLQPQAVSGECQRCAALEGASFVLESLGSVPFITSHSVNAISHKVAGCEIVNTVL